MNSKDYDKITFHRFLNNTRKRLHIPSKKLCYGLCSETMMHYIETGERNSNYLMRNRLLARLGISSEDFEDFIHYDEYEFHQKSQLLIEYVEEKNIIKSKKILNNLLNSVKKGQKIEHQFLLDMKARIMELEKKPLNQIASVYNQAVNITMPNINLLNLDEYVLAPVEYYILLRTLRIESKLDNYTPNELSDFYSIICKAIQTSFHQPNVVAKVYPMAVCGWFDLTSMSSLSSQNFYDIWINSEKALINLKEARRTYYLIELLKLRNDINEVMSLPFLCSKEICENEKKWLVSFQSIYSKYKIDASMDYSGYIYRDSEVYCISDVLLSRRLLYGISIDQLSRNLCSSKTITRIEQGKARPQQLLIEELFTKLGIVSHFRRSEIITDDFSVLNTYKEYKRHMNDSDWKQAEEISKALDDRLKNNKVFNTQVLTLILNERKYRQNLINANDYVKNLKDALKLTLPENVKYSSDSYLSDIEVTILYNLACKKNDIRTLKMLSDKCEFYYKKRIKTHIGLYELIMGTIASQLGDNKEYASSNSISEYIIKEALRQHRAHSIHRNLFNITWNNAMNSNVFYSLETIENLKCCVAIADYSCDFATSKYYNSKLNQVKTNINWTTN